MAKKLKQGESVFLKVPLKVVWVGVNTTKVDLRLPNGETVTCERRLLRRVDSTAKE